MTPTVLGYYKLADGWVEFSTGRGIEGEPIYGITVRKEGGGRFNPDPSRMTCSRHEALRLIRSLQTP